MKDTLFLQASKPNKQYSDGKEFHDTTLMITT